MGTRALPAAFDTARADDAERTADALMWRLNRLKRGTAAYDECVAAIGAAFDAMAKHGRPWL